MRNWLVVGFVALFVISCETHRVAVADVPNGNAAIQNTANELGDEEYAIYGLVIENEKALGSTPISILSRTVPGNVKPGSDIADVIAFLKQTRYGSETPSLIDDYQAKNTGASKVLPKFESHINYSISNSVDDPKKPLLSFSRVAFDTEHRLALVYFEIYRGSRSASGRFIIAEKDGSTWKIREAIPVWSA